MNWRDWHNNCIYVHRLIPLEAIIQLPGGSKHLTIIRLQDVDGKSVTLVNVYNPPTNNEGLKDLDAWLPVHNQRTLPMCIFMDSNLHHQVWNLIGYRSTHKEAATFIKLCGRNGFRLVLPHHIPTFYTTKGKGTTINLIWANYKAADKVSNVQVSEENFGSDHQALKGLLVMQGYKQPKRWAQPTWNMLYPNTFNNTFDNSVASYFATLETNKMVLALSNALYQTQTNLGWMVSHDANRTKSWWDLHTHNPILKTRNQACKWMLMTKSEEATICYREVNNYLCLAVWHAKQSHWKSYLESIGSDIFSAL